MTWNFAGVVESMDRGSMGFHLGQVSSQLEMGGRQVQCKDYS